LSWIEETTKFTWLLRIFGFSKIPMLYMCSPQIVKIDDEHCVVKIPLKRRTKNHENCMYIGALTVGADIAGGLISMYHMKEDRKNARFLFKDMTASYLKRAEGDVYFTCRNGLELAKMVQKAKESGERINQKVSVVATVPDKLGDEPVATFTLTLSVKIPLQQ
jgi:acyl-coenzyme A thioesterase PaaI-like protein